MGNTGSTTSFADSVSQTVNESMQTSIMNCASSSQSSQVITIKGSNNVVSGNQLAVQLTSSIKCLQESQNISQLQSAITNGIVSKASTTNQAVLSSLTATGNTTVKSMVSNAVTNVVTSETISNCAQSLIANQQLKIVGSGNTVTNNDMTTAISQVSNCVSQALNSSAAISKMATAIDNAATATTKAPSLFGGLFSTIGYIAAGFVLFFIFIILLISWSLFGGSSSSSESMPMPGAPPMYGAPSYYS